MFKNYKSLFAFLVGLFISINTFGQIGMVDYSFNPGSGFNGNVNSISVQNDGKILIAGLFSQYNGVSKKQIIRLNWDGGIDNSFASPSNGTNGSINTTLVQNDGKIYAAGNFSFYNDTIQTLITRLNSNGSIDKSFFSKLGAGVTYAMGIQSDGKIVVGGSFVTKYYNRLNIDGEVDTSFHIGSGPNNAIFSVAVQNDQKTIIGGAFTSYNGVSSNRIARINYDGSLDTTFIIGTGFDNTVNSIALQSDGKIIVGGGFGEYDGVLKNRLIRINTDGTIDNSFNVGLGANALVKSVAIQADSKILIGGDFNSYNFYTKRIARVNIDGTVDTNFISNPGFNGSVNIIAISQNNNIIVGGAFTSYNLTPLNKIAGIYAGFEYANTINGKLFADSNLDCINQKTEKRLPFVYLNSVPGNIYSQTNDTGYYSLGAEDSINYTVQPIIPQRLSYMLSNPCPSNYNVYLDANSPKDTSGFDFGFDANLCHQLRTDVSSDRRRRCFRNNTTIYYINEGLASATGVEVHVKFDEYTIPLSASMAYTYDATDSSLVFNIGTLNAGQSGYITIVDSIACISNIVGLTQCTKAWILPPNTCLIDSTTGAGWDNSSMKVEGACVNDTVRFVIYNHGSGDMASPSEYRIYADNVLQSTGTFQLNSGDSLVITVVSGGATIRLEADQIAGHPGNSQPRATVEACGDNGSGGFSIGEVNQAPMDDADVDVEIDCLQIRDSYDPNEKKVSPEGLWSEHIVLPNTLLDYVIHFQNTGTDTAYKVVVVDSLSNDLDLSTLELGASSHPYKTSMSGEGRPVLKFTFDSINLVDSTTNEPLSNGFVKFKIAPKSTTALGTKINNSADIYFDYNFPIKTNTAFVTVGNYPLTSIRDVSTSLDMTVRVYPNPSDGKFQIESLKSKVEKVEVYNILGEKILENVFSNGVTNLSIDLSSQPSGIYFVEIKSKNDKIFKKIIKE